MNATDCINESINTTSIVTVDYTEELLEDLLVRADDSNDTGDVVELWGSEDDSTWRVHLVRGEVEAPRTYTYSLLEDGYTYETGTVEATDLDAALELAADKARPGDTYTSADGEPVTIEIGVVVRQGGEERRTVRSFRVATTAA